MEMEKEKCEARSERVLFGTSTRSLMVSVISYSRSVPDFASTKFSSTFSSSHSDFTIDTSLPPIILGIIFGRANKCSLLWLQH